MQPLVVLWGEESFFREKALKEIESSLLSDQTKDYNLSVFYGQDANVSEIVESARTIPYLSKHRLVVIRNPEKLSPAGKQILASYASNPAKTSCLVFISEKISPNDPLYSALKGLASFKAFKRAESKSISAWIKEETQKRNKAIDPYAISVLRENVGDDLHMLENAIEKLTLFIGQRQKITKEDVEQVAGRSSTYSGFELLNAINANKAPRALSVLYELLAEGKRPAEIIGLLTWHLRRIKKAKDLINEKTPRQQIAGQLRMPVSIFDKFITQANALSREKIEKCLEEVLQADIMIKSGKLKESTALEVLVAKLVLVLG